MSKLKPNSRYRAKHSFVSNIFSKAQRKKTLRWFLLFTICRNFEPRPNPTARTGNKCSKKYYSNHLIYGVVEVDGNKGSTSRQFFLNLYMSPRLSFIEQYIRLLEFVSIKTPFFHLIGVVSTTGLGTNFTSHTENGYLLWVPLIGSYLQLRFLGVFIIFNIHETVYIGNSSNCE